MTAAPGAPVAFSAPPRDCPTIEPAQAAPAASEPPPPAPSASATLPYTIGAAVGGPQGQRRCEFRESIDDYPRTCTVKKNVDGSLTITAPGTKLNPDHGFSFKMGGGPNQFQVAGQLDAFKFCRGPFVGTMLAVHDDNKVSYELRFREHCMIAIY